MVPIYFSCPSTKYRFLVISIFSLKSRYKIPLLHISRQGLQHSPARSIHTSGHCVYFIDRLLTKAHLSPFYTARRSLYVPCAIKNATERSVDVEWLPGWHTGCFRESQATLWTQWSPECLNMLLILVQRSPRTHDAARSPKGGRREADTLPWL